MKPVEIEFQVVMSDNIKQGFLNVFDFDRMPFQPTRAFTITSVSSNSSRGHHAHKSCRQLIACIAGEIKLICTFGIEYEKKVFILNPTSPAVLIEPWVWAEQIYTTNETSSIVFCSDKYYESDYIRDYDEYKRLIRLNKFIHD